MQFTKYVIDLLEEKAKNKQLPMGKACLLAGINPGNFTNWKHGYHSPTLKGVQRLFDAIEAYQPIERTSHE